MCNCSSNSESKTGNVLDGYPVQPLLAQSSGGRSQTTCIASAWRDGNDQVTGLRKTLRQSQRESENGCRYRIGN